MVTRGSQLIVAILVIGTALVVGCAKRPATTAASAPAPTGTAATTGATGGGTSTPMTPPATTAPATPAPTARPSPKEFVAVADLKPIYFDFDKYDIRPGDAKVLDANAQWLKSHGDQLVLIEGHCDERGTNEYNLALGERRAKAAVSYLVSRGVQASRVSLVSYGEERPTCREHTEGCWAKNRRAHFLVQSQ